MSAAANTRRMTLAEFRATGRDVPDLRTAMEDNGVFDGNEGPCPGRIYAGDTWIERNGDAYCCTVASDSRSAPLSELEEFLYEGWAVPECDVRVPCPPLPSPLAVAREFCAQVRAAFTTRILAEIVRRNRTEKYADSVCATHDFCDANMLMAAAFSIAWGQPEDVIDVGDEASAAVWSQAWGIAKRAEFNASRCEAEVSA